MTSMPRLRLSRRSFASGSDAGTSLKVLLQKYPQSNTARDAMRDLGLFTGSTKEEFKDAQAKIEAANPPL